MGVVNKDQIKNPPETPQTLWQYGIEGFEENLNWTRIMPRGVKSLGQQIFFFQSGYFPCYTFPPRGGQPTFIAITRNKSVKRWKQ